MGRRHGCRSLCVRDREEIRIYGPCSALYGTARAGEPGGRPRDDRYRSMVSALERAAPVEVRAPGPHTDEMSARVLASFACSPASRACQLTHLGIVTGCLFLNNVKVGEIKENYC